MTNICGHDRDVLIWALRLAYAMPRTTQDSYRPTNPTPDELAKMRAVDAIHDPAKLATMLAEEGRRLGFYKWEDTVWKRLDRLPALDVYRLVSSTIMLTIWWHWESGGHCAREYTMPQARTILLQWLNLPDGARDEALRVLRGNHADPDELLNTIPIHERAEPRRFDPDPDRGE